MVKTYTSIVERNREFRAFHILYFLNEGLSTIVLFALIYLGAYFTDGSLKEAVLYTGGFLFLIYSFFCVYRHVRIWKNSRAAIKLVRFSEESVGLGNGSHAYQALNVITPRSR
jgi:hypothetical protein